MIFFVDNNGTIINSVPEHVYQGAVNANNIYVVAPFANNLTATVAFRFPSGVITTPDVMRPETLNLTDQCGKVYNVWSYSKLNNITEAYGIVTAQFYFHTVDNRVIATSPAQFPVTRGVPSLLPETPTEDIYAQILSVISSIQSDLANGYFTARSIYSYNSIYSYGINEIVYYPRDEYGVFVKSLYTDNTYPPFSNKNELDPHWKIVANFDEIMGVADTVVSAAQVATDKAMEATSSAVNAKNSETLAKEYMEQAKEAAQNYVPPSVDGETLILIKGE